MVNINHKLNQYQSDHFDAVVVGAGFSGLYMLHRLREAGLSTQVYEAGSGVGGVWHWNRYPGARCDCESIYYCYTFSDELSQEWTWSSRYPGQPEILDYLNYVADKFDLRRDIQFNSRVKSAQYDEENLQWIIRLKDGSQVTAKYFISAVGCLSASNVPKFEGLEQFKGEWYHTGNWPHEPVDFKGKRVGLIGTGSSGVQAIPVIAEDADHLTIFQRTPQYSMPARNYPYDQEYIRNVKENYKEIKEKMRHSFSGLPVNFLDRSALDDSPEERQKVYEDAWQKGGFDAIFLATYPDLATNAEANETAAEFIRSKISDIVHDPEIARLLTPTYYYAAKRPITDTNYYETYNRRNVSLVDVKSTPIVEITEKGIKTSDSEYELDIIVFATGYDAITGALFKIDIFGRGGITLKEKWENGANLKTYLGITTSNFPNFFMITGPESPSVLSNNPISIEQHVEWISDCIDYLGEHRIKTIEANKEAEEKWSQQCLDLANNTLMTKVDSWYTGGNINNKPRSFPIFTGGVGYYRQLCNEVAEKGYEGFSFESVSKITSK